jgi:hypothetical protein
MKDKSKNRENPQEREWFADEFCTAFPDGVPRYILDWGGHFTPKPGDHGILFEPREEVYQIPNMVAILKDTYPDREPPADQKSA